MSGTVAIVQARVASTRLPGKVLYELAGRPMIAVMLSRLTRCRTLDGIAVATGIEPSNEALAAVVEAMGVAVFRGSEEDVLGRYAAAAAAFGAGVVVRLTADCPLMDPEVVDLLVARRAEQGLDFCTNVLPPTWPDGLDVAVFTRAALERAAEQATRPSDREHVVPWMWRHSTLFGCPELKAENISADGDHAAHRWTVDEAADYRLMRALAREMGDDDLIAASYSDILAVLRRKPEIARINASLVRDEGLARSQILDMVEKVEDRA